MQSRRDGTYEIFNEPVVAAKQPRHGRRFSRRFSKTLLGFHPSPDWEFPGEHEFCADDGVRSGSKCESLTARKYCPLCARSRTRLSAGDMAASVARMSHKRGYARLATRYGDIRVCPACGLACRYAHAGYMLLMSADRPTATEKRAWPEVAEGPKRHSSPLSHRYETEIA
jgi:hypothetical protein